jgi:MoaA/NifB/PqqE/SkfB family radical SAM enzyme
MKVDLKIRFSCNNYCRFCVQGLKRYKFPDKKLDVLKKSLAEGRSKGKNSLVLTGGEPTLHKNFFEIISFAKKIGYKGIQIQSNGRMFYYKDFCQRTIECGATEFSPALHGPTPEIHDFLTGAQGSFRQTVKGIMNLKSLGMHVISNSVVTKPNMYKLSELAKLLVSLGVDQFQMAFVHLGGTAMENRNWITPRKTVLEPLVKKALDIGIKAGKKVMTEAIPYCFMSGYENYLAEHFMPEAMVFDSNFKVDNFSHYRKTEGKIKGPNCKKCKYFKVCEGPWHEYPELFGWDEFIPITK